MVRRGGYQTQAQKEGRSAGQRKRRMARERKRRNRERNIYKISVRESVISKANIDKSELAVYGIYKNGSEWVLTAMAIQRSEENWFPIEKGQQRVRSMNKWLFGLETAR